MRADGEEDEDEDEMDDELQNWSDDYLWVFSGLSVYRKYIMLEGVRKREIRK